MKTIQKTYEVYSFNELSESAKQKALQDNAENLNEWWDHVFEDVKTIASLMGINIDNIYFSGFYSQGDGACFEGNYGYNKNSVKLVMEYAPQDNELHDIVRTLANIQRRNFYQLYASIKHRGHYYHELCTDIEIERDNYNGQDVNEDDVNDLTDTLHEFMQWIYKQLENEYDYLTSEENFTEYANDCGLEFYEDGKLTE